MRTTALILTLLNLLLPAFAAPQPKPKPISIAALQQFKAPLTIEAVEKAFGPSVGQPGPRVSYPSADHKGMSLWFWIQAPQRHHITDKAEWVVGCVILATTITEEKRQVVWPLTDLSKSPEELIRRVNDTYEQNK